MKKHECSWLFCDGIKYKEFNEMSLCEYEKFRDKHNIGLRSSKADIKSKELEKHWEIL